MALRSLSLNLDDALYQAALGHAQREGKTLEQVLAEFITSYAATAPKPAEPSPPSAQPPLGTTAPAPPDSAQPPFGTTPAPPAGAQPPLGSAQPPLGTAPATYTVQPGDTLSKIARQVYSDPAKYPLIQKANNLVNPSLIHVGQVLVIPPLAGAGPTSPAPVSAQPPLGTPATPPSQPAAPRPTSAQPPLGTPASPPAGVDPSAPIPGASYGTLPIVGRPTDRPAAQHGDLNLALRGYSRTTAKLGLIDLGGRTDNRAPQLVGLFADKRSPVFSSVYRANQWDWGRNARGAPVTDFEVTVAGLAAQAGETVHVPEAGYSIGSGYAVLVLYADADRVTLKYTGEDSVVNGYTIHVESVCPEPSLLTLYERMNAAGRSQLPALRAGQALGRARGNEIQVAIRDTGRFMDPRTRKDWWRGK
jgi:LysM repeat protein